MMSLQCETQVQPKFRAEVGRLYRLLIVTLSPRSEQLRTLKHVSGVAPTLQPRLNIVIRSFLLAPPSPPPRPSWNIPIWAGFELSQWPASRQAAEPTTCA